MSQPKEVRGKLRKPMPERNLQAQLLEEAKKVVEPLVQAQKELYARSDAPATTVGTAAIFQFVKGMRQENINDEEAVQQDHDKNIPVLKRAFLRSARLKKENELPADDLFLRFLLVLYRKDTEGPEERDRVAISLQNWFHSTVFSHYQTLVDVHGWWKSETGSWNYASFETSVVIAEHFFLTLEIRDILQKSKAQGTLTEDAKKKIEVLKEKRKWFVIFLESKLDKKLRADVLKREEHWGKALGM